MKLGVFIFLLVLLSSCADLKKSEQLDSLEGLSVKLVELQDLKMGSVDTIQLYMGRVNLIDSLIILNYQNDTLNFQNAKDIDAFMNLKAVFPELNSSLIFIDSAIVLKTNAIESLKKDIENSTGDRSKYPAFISFEEGEVGKIETQLEESQLRLSESIMTFNSLYPAVNDYLVSLNNKEQ